MNADQVAQIACDQTDRQDCKHVVEVLYGEKKRHGLCVRSWVNASDRVQTLLLGPDFGRMDDFHIPLFKTSFISFRLVLPLVSGSAVMSLLSTHTMVVMAL